MKRKKIMVVFGTRPEAIKMAPLVHALQSFPSDFEVLVCVTGQHREMLDQVLKVFNITPDIDLNLMKKSQSLSNLTSLVLSEVAAVLAKHEPDVVLVHGDTTTTLATAMAAFYANIKVGHVEAGLRTFDLNAPFPEEFNRQITSKLARWHFAPTELSRNNLITEGVDASFVKVTGNTVIDALFLVLKEIEEDPGRLHQLENYLQGLLPFNYRTERFILITGHRRENFGQGFVQIFEALSILASCYPCTHFVYPLHLNPNVRQPARSLLAGFENIHLIEPLDYEPFVFLLKYSYLVLTDSGGIQEEAPSLGKPVLVMRKVTERPEALKAGTVMLVGAEKNRIVRGVERLLKDEAHYIRMSKAHNPYGDGHSSMRIIQFMKQQLASETEYE